jgi:chromate transport protein ChrA
VTFTPCFLWIFLGGPYIERLRGNIRLSTALSAITAAVVGVVLNLAVWFAMNALFPNGHGLDWVALAISVVAFVGMWNKWTLFPVVGSGLAGLAYKTLPAALKPGNAVGSGLPARKRRRPCLGERKMRSKTTMMVALLPHHQKMTIDEYRWLLNGIGRVRRKMDVD